MADPFYADPEPPAAPLHPYYPPSALLPNYVPNAMPVLQLVAVLGVAASAVVGSALRQTARVRRGLRDVDRLAAGWFALSGFLHIVFEGYYLWFRDEIPGMSTPFAELWKEYSLSDSRYLTGDVFTVSVETITCFIWGPLSWLTFILILRNSPSRHIAQIIMCIAHLYGVALYYLTNYNEGRLNGLVFSRPEVLYYWVYYAGMNLPWAVVPAVLLRDSWAQVRSAFVAVRESEVREWESRKEAREREGKVGEKSEGGRKKKTK